MQSVIYPLFSCLSNGPGRLALACGVSFRSKKYGAKYGAHPPIHETYPSQASKPLSSSFITMKLPPTRRSFSSSLLSTTNSLYFISLYSPTVLPTPNSSTHQFLTPPFSLLTQFNHSLLPTQNPPPKLLLPFIPTFQKPSEFVKRSFLFVSKPSPLPSQTRPISTFGQNPLQKPPEFIQRSYLSAPKHSAFSSQTRPISSFRQNPLQKPLEFTESSILFAPEPSPFSSQTRPISTFRQNPLRKPLDFIQRPYLSALKPSPVSSQIRPISIRNPTQEPSPDSMDSAPSPIPVVSTFSSPFENSPPQIDASSSLRKPLSLWPGMYHSPVTNALWEARSSIFERLLDSSKEGPPQTELLTKTPSQSRTSIIYNFSSDYILREQYRDPWNEVRIGKLLEDLDALAGTIAVKHCSDDDSTTRPLLLVTASVDKMVLKKPLRVDTDLKITGAVTWVGRSSIEIQIEVTQSQEDNSEPSDPVALTANFTFVARDSKTGKSAPVNRLSPETEQEKFLYKEGEARDGLRKRKREENKREFEGQSFHWKLGRLKALLAEGRIFCDLPALADRDSILMRDTGLENSLICQPQQRNLHGRIFGGFLMHRAFELAFSTAYAFVGQMPCFLEVDHVDFLKPVDVGDFLRFKSCVLYTQLENPEQPRIYIEVVAHVTRPELRTSEVSNTFYFTFTVCSGALTNGLRIRNVVPATEEEARRVLDRMDANNIFG